MKFYFLVAVDTDTYQNARQIMNERINYDERYFVTPEGEPVSRDDAGPEDIELDYSIVFTDVDDEPEAE